MHLQILLSATVHLCTIAIGGAEGPPPLVRVAGYPPFQGGNDIIDIYWKKDLIVLCSTYFGLDQVAGANLVCVLNDAETVNQTGSQEASVTFTICSVIHKAECKCILYYHNATERWTTKYIRYIFPVQLIRASDNNTFYAFNKRDVPSIVVDFNATGDDFSTTIQHLGKEVPRSKIQVQIVPTDTNYGHKMTITWKSSFDDYDDRGNYTATISNQARPPLVFGFTLQATSTCTHRFCDCQQLEWLQMFHHKFFLLNTVIEDFVAAMTICDRLGGYLALVKADVEQYIVENIDQDPYNGEHSKIWIGLHRASPNSSWMWLDGDSYETDPPWIVPSAYRYGGVAMTNQDWSLFPTDFKHAYVCESREPCTAKVLLSTSDKHSLEKSAYQLSLGRWQRGSTITIHSEQSLMIHCTPIGPEQDIYEVKATCGRVVRRSELGKRTLSFVQLLNFDMHNKNCSCILTRKDGTKWTESTHFNVRTAPRLVNENDNNKILIMSSGENIVVKFDIYANPVPWVKDLRKFSFPLSRKDYITTITPLGKVGHFSVVTRMHEFDVFRSSTYTLTIENGMEENLPLRFTLHETTACAANYCICKKADWKFFKKGKKFIKTNMVARNFSTATWLCENLGGQLLKIQDVKTEKFVKALHKKWLADSWMGLSYKKSGWTWIDGKQLKRGDYEKWGAKRTTDQNCVAVEWTKTASWRPTACKLRRYHVCESTEPCSVNPVMSLDHSRVDNNITIDFVNSQDIVIKCTTQGYPHIVIRVQVHCTGGIAGEVVGERSVTTLSHIDINAHMETCYCQAFLGDGSTKQVHFTVYFKTRPRLVKEDDNYKRLIVREGEKPELAVLIYANPVPVVHKMVMNGSEVSSRLYKVDIQSQPKTFYFKVAISMPEFNKSMSGRYSLSLDNGIDDTLVYVFDLEENKNLKAVEEESCLVPRIIVGLLVLVTIIVMVIVANMKAKVQLRYTVRENRLYSMARLLEGRLESSNTYSLGGSGRFYSQGTPVDQSSLSPYL